MTIQEKKQAIIEKVTNSNSDEFITLLYYNMNKEIKWDETDEGKNLINILLEKSQQETIKSNPNSFENFSSSLYWSILNSNPIFCSRLVVPHGDCLGASNSSLVYTESISLF